MASFPSLGPSIQGGHVTAVRAALVGGQSVIQLRICYHHGAACRKSYWTCPASKVKKSLATEGYASVIDRQGWLTTTAQRSVIEAHLKQTGLRYDDCDPRTRTTGRPLVVERHQGNGVD